MPQSLLKPVLRFSLARWSAGARLASMSCLLLGPVAASASAWLLLLLRAPAHTWHLKRSAARASALGADQL